MRPYVPLASRRVQITLTLLLSFCFLSASVHTVHAEETASPATHDTLSSCFDFYTFGSVVAEPALELSTVAAGSPLSYTLTIKNGNKHPFLEGTVLVKIMRSVTDEKTTAGSDVVDQFVAVSDLTLKAGEEKNITRTWNVPRNVPRGEYYIAPYVISADRFNMDGLSFTTDVTGPTASFVVESEVTHGVRFDTTKLTLDGSAYQVIGIPPLILEHATSAVDFTAPLQNNTTLPIQGIVTWRLYFWDGLHEKNLLSSTSESIKLHPRSSQKLTYTVADTAYPIYFIEGEFTGDDGRRSLISARFVRFGIESARMNDVGVNAYPLTSGATAYACFQDLFTAPSEPDSRADATLKLSIQDHDGKTVASDAYKGKTPFEIMALPLTIPELPAPLTKFTLTATLEQGGKVIDEVRMAYDCAALGATCPPPQSSETIATQATSLWTLLAENVKGVLIGGGLLILALFALRHLIIHMRRGA
jgi:hypothetical protein